MLTIFHELLASSLVFIFGLSVFFIILCLIADFLDRKIGE